MNGRFVTALAAVSLIMASSAQADYHIVSPYEIDLGELEIEHNGSSTFDHRPGMGGAASQTIEFGTGLTHWWHSEIEFGFERESGGGQPTLLTQIVTENMFQLTEPGEYFADLGMYIEYGQSLTRGKYAGSNQVTFGPVIGKDVGHTTHTLNLFFTRQLGPNQETQGLDMSYAWQSRWNIWAPLSPAIEIYGDSGIVGQSPRLSQQQLLIGPVGVGRIQLSELGLGNAGKLRYEVGWLFGATQASPAGALRWRLELELPF
jgi:hypothetical protein